MATGINQIPKEQKVPESVVRIKKRSRKTAKLTTQIRIFKIIKVLKVRFDGRQKYLDVAVKI